MRNENAVYGVSIYDRKIQVFLYNFETDKFSGKTLPGDLSPSYSSSICREYVKDNPIREEYPFRCVATNNDYYMFAFNVTMEESEKKLNILPIALIDEVNH